MRFAIICAILWHLAYTHFGDEFDHRLLCTLTQQHVRFLVIVCDECYLIRAAAQYIVICSRRLWISGFLIAVISSAIIDSIIPCHYLFPWYYTCYINHQLVNCHRCKPWTCKNWIMLCRLTFNNVCSRSAILILIVCYVAWFSTMLFELLACFVHAWISGEK
jgi:hypothetical protein